MFLNTLSDGLVSSIYHLIIFLIIWDGFDSEAQNQIAGIKKMLKLISSAELWWFE